MGFTLDAEPVLNACIDGLDLPLFQLGFLRKAAQRGHIEANNRPVQQQLASLRFFDLKHGVPTRAGILMFGHTPLHFVPCAWIQFLRVEGETLSGRVLQEKSLSGDMASVMTLLDLLFEANLARAPKAVTLLREVTVSPYPLHALREIAINGVIHRDYGSTAPLRINWFDDRIEIQSPGGLYGEASQENFPIQTSYRNPIIAEALKALGYVNRFGRGVVSAQESMAANGNLPIEFVFDRHFVKAVLRAKPT